ncbi:hypothetical protein NKH77_07905 [Streptomyces sp. M19]
MPLDAGGVGVASLLPVEIPRLSPDRTGPAAVAEGGVRVAEAVEGVGRRGAVAEVAAQGEERR